MPKFCSVPGCTKLHNAHGLCGMHEQRMKRTGTFDISRRPNGSGNINKAGYVDIRIGCEGRGKGQGRRIYEHVWVAEKALGHPLPKDAKVHHINGNRSDNRPDNLVICPNEAYHRLLHKRQREIWGE